MKKRYQISGEGVKSLYGLPRSEASLASSMPTEEQLDALEWARDFMNKYERKKKCQLKLIN